MLKNGNMNALELTKDQISQLFKMIDILYSKHTVYLSSFDDTILDYWGYKSCGQIHWFDLSWLLLNKILERESSPNITVEKIKEFGIVCFNRSKCLHPIDYLYGLFKQYGYGN